MYYMMDFGEKNFSLTVKFDVISHVTFKNLKKCSPSQNLLETQYLPLLIKKTKISKFVRWLDKNPAY